MQDLNFIIDQIGKDKGIDRKVIISALESAMLSASKKKFGPNRDIEARYNEEIGEIELFEFKEVVEEVKDPNLEVSIEEARKIDENIEVGDSLGFKLDISEFGRIPVQMAKQVILQKVREAENDIIYEEFKHRKGEIIHGIVQRIEKGTILLNLGRAEAILPKREQIPKEKYKRGDRLRALILDVERSSRGTKIILSRSHPDFLVKLFEQEVPEIAEGIIKVVSAVRDPGERAKIAVYSEDPDVDPVGACVGMKGSRVQAIVQELQGERIDIVPWSTDTTKFICNAISPAKISRVYKDEQKKEFEIIVANDQLPLAIGKRGQNVRLASLLTGWNIEIKSEAKMEKIMGEMIQEFKKIPGLGEMDARILYNEGFTNLEELAMADASEFEKIPEIGVEKGLKFIIGARKLLNMEVPDEKEDLRKQSLDKLKGVGEKTLASLKSKGYYIIGDILDSTVDDLTKVEGIGKKKAAQLLDAAKKYVEQKE
ncbi:MAG: transcription termination/antitermination protein NusA [Deltaproteobacteria bacterium]|nr:MAG: transcription termination/antitermination protein NusA [Deltaproteobacteria bacterium]